MRLRNWIAVVISVFLLAAAGTIGILVNRSALEAADSVHRDDTTALATNNANLISQLQANSAEELRAFAKEGRLRLIKGLAADRAALVAYAEKSATFQYGMLVTDLDGAVLTSGRDRGLPALTGEVWAPMWAQARSGNQGHSSIMDVDGIPLAAVAVPIMVNGARAGYLIGLNQLVTTPLQRYMGRLKGAADAHEAAAVDATGTIGASGEATLIGRKVHGDIQAALRRRGVRFVEYTEGNVEQVALVVADSSTGWGYVRMQTKSSFEGPVHDRSQTLNVTLLAMLFIGVAGVSLLGYRTQVQRRRADERFQALFQHAPDLVSVLDATGRIEYTSPSARAVLGYESGALARTSVFDLLHPEDEPRMREKLSALLADPSGVLRLQCRVRSATADYRWFDITASNQMHNPALSGVVINARDVSENRAFQERLAHEAQHDALTGLPNRRRMQDALDSSLSRDAVAVLFVDLDGFKPVNDAYGHETGDELLRQVAERLSACVRHGDVLARVGGDEFVILMPGVVCDDDAEAMCGRLRYALELPFRIDGQEIRVGASVGVHLAAAAEDPDTALRAADHAMYEMKRSAGGRGEPERVGRHRAEA